MNLKTLREEQCRLMAQRIAAIRRIRHGLHYTLSHLTLPIETTENLGDANLEALSAFNERFGKLQDVIAATMKQGTLLSGTDAETFPQVLSFMSKCGVIEDIEAWKSLRMLRNIGAHEYDIDPIRQADYFASLMQELPDMEAIADRLIKFSADQLECPSTTEG